MKNTPTRFTAYSSPRTIIQSLEKPKLRPETRPSAQGTLTQEDAPKRLAVVALPAVLLAAWCLASWGTRTAGELLHPDEDRREAQTVAASVLRGVTATSVASADLQYSTQTAFSVRRNAPVSEWSVTTGGGANTRFAVRINSYTKKVYAINRIQTASLAIARPAQAGDGISPDAARRLAWQYLQTMGVSAQTISTDTNAASEGELLRLDGETDLYLFTYRHAVSGLGDRLIKIGVDRETGELAYFWNPSAGR